MEGVITTKQFSKTLLGCEIHFYIMRMQQSVLVWIGRDSSFKNLSVAMKSQLVGNRINNIMLQHLCTRTLRPRFKATLFKPGIAYFGG